MLCWVSKTVGVAQLNCVLNDVGLSHWFVWWFKVTGVDVRIHNVPNVRVVIMWH